MVHETLSTYQAERERFHWELPEHFNFAEDVLGRWAQDAEKRGMLWVDELGDRQDLTFRHFADRSSSLAGGLSELGIKKGDRVLVVIPPEPAWWETFMALLKLGAIVVP